MGSALDYPQPPCFPPQSQVLLPTAQKFLTLTPRAFTKHVSGKYTSYLRFTDLSGTGHCVRLCKFMVDDPEVTAML